VSEAGARKYTRDGWRNVIGGIERYQAAIGRHYVPLDNDMVDLDTECYHLAQIAWNAMAALELYLDGEERKNENCTPETQDPKYQSRFNRDDRTGRPDVL